MEETSGTIYFDLVRSHGSLDKVNVDVVTTAGMAMSHVGSHTRLLRVQEVGPGMGGGRLKKRIGEDRSGKGIGVKVTGEGLGRVSGGIREELGVGWARVMGIRQEQGVGWARAREGLSRMSRSQKVLNILPPIKII